MQAQLHTAETSNFNQLPRVDSSPKKTECPSSEKDIHVVCMHTSCCYLLLLAIRMRHVPEANALG
jgi:hypothetical protein